MFDMFDRLTKNRNPLMLSRGKFPEFLVNLWTLFFSFVKFVLFCFLFFFPFIFRFAKIASGSMTPTYHTNEIVVCSSLSYGLKPINLLGFELRNFKTPFTIKPKLGDTVAFYENRDMVFMKRILGCPGDRIQFRHGIPIINGVPVKLKYKGQYSYIENEKPYVGDLYEEELPNGVKHSVLYYSNLGEGFQDFTSEFVVPAGHYFMIGDNRQDSLDARCLIGFTSENNIIGKVYMITFSNGNVSTLNLWKFLSSIRFKRCFSWVF
jgi:signal peptidase I